MQGDFVPFLLSAFPMLAAPLAYAIGRKDWRRSVCVLSTVSALALIASAWLLCRALGGAPARMRWDGFCGQGLLMEADGFRALYACVASLMWLCTSLFSFDYFRHGEDVPRYAFFTLVTLGATLGVLLSDSLYSTFLFFEVMSLSSYPWVAQEQTRDALRAAQTYLYVAVIGGLVMLMGLFLLPQGLATLSYGALSAACAAVETNALWLPACLMLFGFGAKAGAFPLHIWLPKAHPVAPAPASALLSGMLTKAGVFGVIVLTCKVLRFNAAWGALIFWVGVVTMALGALLALLSVNLKRTLACSSLSQIGFILVGLGLCSLLGEENALPAWGALQHMLNHSLLKLLLFLCAGVVAMNAHALALDDVRGFGRGKPLLHAAFLSGLLGLGGIPFFNGYASKTLIHEGLLEYCAHLRLTQGNALPYAVAEWVFVISGGLTLAYMLKLYVCLFWQKHPTKQDAYQAQKRYLSPLGACVLALCAMLPPLLGVAPALLLSDSARLSMPFWQAASPESIVYFSLANLMGAGKSIVIGLLVYLLIVRRLLLTRAPGGECRYANRLPVWLDMENGLYRPLMALLVKLGGWLGTALDRFPNGLFAYMRKAGTGCARALDRFPDGLFACMRKAGAGVACVLAMPVEMAALAMRSTLLHPFSMRREPAPVGTKLTYTLGRGMDRVAAFLNRTVCRRKPIRVRFVSALAAGQEVLMRQTKRLSRSISFALLMFCLGLFATLAYLLF